MSKSRMIRFSILIAAVATVAVLFQWRAAPDISCVPNEERTQLEVISKNAVIEQISLKYDNGFLKLVDQNDHTLDMMGESGMEYICVAYKDIWGKRGNLYFEVSLSSPGALIIAKLKQLNGNPIHQDFYY